MVARRSADLPVGVGPGALRCGRGAKETRQSNREVPDGPRPALARHGRGRRRPEGRRYHEPGPHPLIQGALPRAGSLAEGAVPPDAEPHRMSRKLSSQPTHYDRRRVAAFSPVSEAVEKLDLPLIRSRKARVICNAIAVQIEDGGDSPIVNDLLLEALRAA